MRTFVMQEDDRAQFEKEIEWARRCGNRTDNGIYFSEELAGPDGCEFVLLAPLGTPEKELEKAESCLRNKRDVVFISALYVPPEMVADDERDKPCATEDERIAKIRKIVEEKSFDKVEGYCLDLFTASVIIKVYDAINDENKKKFAALSIPKMAHVAFSMLKK